jgi:riboflavin kinase / FMN adenylyltransferase
LLDFHPILLEEQTPLRLLFHRRLREERRWPSPEALKEQIMLDVAQAKRYLHLMRLLGNASS